MMMLSCPHCRKRNLNGTKGLRIHIARFCPKTKESRRADADVRNTATTSKAMEDSDLSDTPSSEHDDVCNVCGVGGNVLCCDTCSLVFHTKCLFPPLESAPEGTWSCPHCVVDGLLKSKPSKKDIAEAERSIQIMREVQRRVLKKKSRVRRKDRASGRKRIRSSANADSDRRRRAIDMSKMLSIELVTQRIAKLEHSVLEEKDLECLAFTVTHVKSPDGNALFEMLRQRLEAVRAKIHEDLEISGPSEPHSDKRECEQKNSSGDK